MLGVLLLIPPMLASNPGLAAQQTTHLEPDHAHVSVSDGAPEGAALPELGITQWPAAANLGEVVAWIGFQCETFHLELTWVTYDARPDLPLVIHYQADSGT